MFKINVIEDYTSNTIFNGDIDTFLEVNNYDEELEEILNQVNFSNSETFYIVWSGQKFIIEKEYEEIQE